MIRNTVKIVTNLTFVTKTAAYVDVENDDPDDDEIIAFYLSQAANRSSRTDPMTGATKRKPAPTKPVPKNDTYSCVKCEFIASKQDILTAHIV